MNLAPVVLFAYKRPEHTRDTLLALQKNKLAGKSQLTIFIDGLKSNASAEDRALHQQVIEIAKSKNWCGETKVIESTTNKGLAASIVFGVEEILKESENIIVLEDDLQTSPLFLDFMNTALKKYAQTPDVACISGYVYPLTLKMSDAFFLKGADCWGWATWKNKWKNTFVNNPEQLYTELLQSGKLNDFEFNTSYPYLQMLKDRLEGKNQSWAILWYAAAFLKNQYCLYPPSSFVYNSGNDGSGTNSNNETAKFNTALELTEIPSFPEIIAEYPPARKAFEDFFRDLTGTKKSGTLQILKQKLKSILGQ